MDNHVSALRRKLGPTRDGRERIRTVRHAGSDSRPIGGAPGGAA